MSSCCRSTRDVTARQFDERRVRVELASYRKRGPGPTTRRLLEGLRSAGAARGTLLDIGSGVGVLTFELLAAGCDSATCIDLSPAALQVGGEEARRRGLGGRIVYQEGDFAEPGAQRPTADLVALDRVVCCYPDLGPLLDAAARHSREFLAMSYPRDVWYVRLGFRCLNLVRGLGGNGFRIFLHPPERIAGILSEAGFALVSRVATPVWSVDILRR
ncbi:MAG TPA: class I SAM-dependent methyltransferase [Gemmatimonadales bacterium]|nr:class I SAM-dependent methyltransferase [Gemmatimonadales bacterium]